jgi:photosystem II stability/assembly factor-like uncharacterized protein
LDPTNESEPAPQALTRRARRAVTLIATSLAIIVVASLLYLHPKIGGDPKPPTVVLTPSPKLIHDNYFADFNFVTPKLGWALVQSPTTARYWIYNTTDGAKTWQQQLAADNTDRGNDIYGFFGRLKSFQFFDQTHGLAFATAHDLYTTSDGGKHWTKLTLPPYGIQSLTFSDPDHAWLIGWTQTIPASPANTVYHYESTSDGGKTWTALPAPPLAKKQYGFAITGLKFRTPTEGWASGTDSDNPAVYTSNDGGVTWTQIPMSATRESAQGKYSATSDMVLLPVRGVMAVFRDSAFTSMDGGKTWRPQPLPAGSSYHNFAFQDATHWWAMQYDGNLYKTSDAGRTWNHVSFQLDEVAYTQLGVIDSKHAWARLDSSNPKRRGYGLALTGDGGVHWTYANVPNPP